MKNLVGRVALRVEGDWWVAYYASPDKMDDAIEIARSRMGIVKQNSAYKAAFMGLIQDVISGFIEAKTGVNPDWNDPVPAPEHERAGRA